MHLGVFDSCLEAWHSIGLGGRLFRDHCPLTSIGGRYDLERRGGFSESIMERCGLNRLVVLFGAMSWLGCFRGVQDAGLIWTSRVLRREHRPPGGDPMAGARLDIVGDKRSLGI